MTNAYWATVQRWFNRQFRLKIEIILDDHKGKLIINGDPLPEQIFYDVDLVLQDPQILHEKLARKLRDATRLKIIAPAILVILKGKLEMIDITVLANIIGGNYRELTVLHWSKLKQQGFANMTDEEFCKNYYKQRFRHNRSS